MDVLANTLQLLRGLLPKLGPYLLVEIALPGGTLIALLLYLYRCVANRRMRASGKGSPLQKRSAGETILKRTAAIVHA